MSILTTTWRPSKKSLSTVSDCANAGRAVRTAMTSSAPGVTIASLMLILRNAEDSTLSADRGGWRRRGNFLEGRGNVERGGGHVFFRDLGHDRAHVDATHTNILAQDDPA